MINKYEVLYNVVEHGNITKAAKALNLTQSGISQTILNLENTMGFPLITRGKNGVKLTRNGERIFEYIREIVVLNERIQQEASLIKGFETGTLRIGTFSSITMQWFPTFLRNFEKMYPKISIKIYESDYIELEEMILNGTIDCAFLSSPKSKQLEYSPVIKDRLLCIVSDQHPLRHLSTISLEQLQQETFILPKKGWNGEVKQFFTENKLKPTIKFELSDDGSIIAMVANNFGISIRPEMTLTYLPDNIHVLTIEKDPYRTIGIATNQDYSPATKSFVKCVNICINSTNQQMF